MRKLSTLILLCVSSMIWAQQWNPVGVFPQVNGLNIMSDKQNRIYVGGGFLNANGHQYVAQWNGQNWTELGGIDALAANGQIRAMCQDNSGNIYVAGAFTNSSGQPYVAKFDGLVWSEVSGLNANGSINALCCDKQNHIYAAGAFQLTGMSYVAHYNGSSWSALGGTTLAANDYIFALLADSSGNIYASGDFKNAQGFCYVAKWDGTNWNEVGGLNNLKANAGISELCKDGSEHIYAAGAFTNDSNRRYVATFNGTSWSALGGNYSFPGLGGQIYALQTNAAGTIFAAGGFHQNNLRFVAQYKNGVWSELGGAQSLGANNYIYGICISPTQDVYVTGGYTNLAGEFYVARYGTPTAVETTEISSQITIAPNPVKDLLQVQVPESFSDYTIRMYTCFGQLLYEATSNTMTTWVPTNTLASGVYYLSVYNTKKKLCIPFTK
ncbi:MAG: T9SS type A sorting domain-containing protein [Chitinophagaceae bacterium]|nr:T9SS type A sorting domain-containing protein [Chitinophagaceae bacterium]